jgi:putative metallohydrolase (TIGR04338 family)
MTSPDNVTHGEYQDLWLRSLGTRAAAEWKKPRDSQRARVYRAEDKVAQKLKEPNLGSVASTQDVVDSVVNSDWWQAVAPHRPLVVVADGRGRRSGGSIGGEIRLPRRYRTRLVVLHELAHEWVTCPVRAPHGPEFAGAFLNLIGVFHSDGVAALMSDAFAYEGVRVEAATE